MSFHFQTLFHPLGSTADTWDHFCTVDSIFLMHLPISMPIPCCFIFCTSVIYSNVWKTKSSDLLSVSLDLSPPFFQNVLAIFTHWFFPVTLEYTLLTDGPRNGKWQTEGHKGLQASWPVSKTPRNSRKCWGGCEVGMLGGGGWSSHGSHHTHHPGGSQRRCVCLSKALNDL